MSCRERVMISENRTLRQLSDTLKDQLNRLEERITYLIKVF